MKPVLALDTCTPWCTVAVTDGQGRVLAERSERVGQGHSRLLLGMIDEILERAGLALGDCGAIAFGRGPGSFTGIRIGAAAVYGLALGADLPVVPVSTLAAIAVEVGAPRVLVALDARMGQVYWGAYRVQPNALGVEDVCGEHLAAPNAVQCPGASDDEEEWVGAGSGWQIHDSALRAAVDGRVRRVLVDAMPAAAGIARIGETEHAAGRSMAAERAVLVYLRDEVAVRAGPGLARA